MTEDSESSGIRDVRLVLSLPNGEITYLLGTWGAVTAAEAAADISSGRYRYRQINRSGQTAFFDVCREAVEAASLVMHT